MTQCGDLTSVSLGKSRPREKEKKKGMAKVPSLLGTSRTVRTRSGNPTAMLANVGTLRGHGLASALLRILLGGVHRLGVAPTTLGPIGMSGEVYFTSQAARYYGLGVTLAPLYHDELEVRSYHYDLDALCIFVFNCMPGLVVREIHLRLLS